MHTKEKPYKVTRSTALKCAKYFPVRTQELYYENILHRIQKPFYPEKQTF